MVHSPQDTTHHRHHHNKLADTFGRQSRGWPKRAHLALEVQMSKRLLERKELIELPSGSYCKIVFPIFTNFDFEVICFNGTKSCHMAVLVSPPQPSQCFEYVRGELKYGRQTYLKMWHLNPYVYIWQYLVESSSGHTMYAT